MTEQSLIERIARLPPAERATLRALAGRTSAAARWRAMRRPSQAWPEDGRHPWSWWLLMTGRGWGKTLTGISALVEAHTERGYMTSALVGRTAGDVRRTLIEGRSGLLRVAHAMGVRVRHNPSTASVRWPNGGVTMLFSADAPESFRGPEVQLALADELATYTAEGFENLEMMLRLRAPDGGPPRGIGMTSPRAKKWLADLSASKSTRVTRGSTYDNAANLPAAYLARITERFRGSPRAAQEIHGVLSLDTPGALWKQGRIDRHRVDTAPALDEVVVGVDPAITADEDSDETGIVVAGAATLGGVRHGYVLEDRSLVAEPHEWAAVVVETARRWSARVVAEGNQGGEMVRSLIRQIDPGLRVDLVWAREGKALRAEPVATLAAQGRVHHVGRHETLESELTSWAQGDPASPDRLDACVYAVTALRLSSVILAATSAPERFDLTQPVDPDDDMAEVRRGMRDLLDLRR